MSEFFHTPVLLQEVIEYLEPKPGKFIVDGTADGGGHSTEILKRIEGGRLLAIEWDADMAKRLGDRLGERKFDAKYEIVNGSYADLKGMMEERGLPKADGLLLDLGFSSEQLQESGRGFSFDRDEPLFMTYSDDSKPVQTVLKELKEFDLANIIYEYSGERYSRRIAKAIKDEGRKRTISTSKELADIVRQAVPRGYERGRIDPATRTFQALRIYANDELGNVERILKDLPEVLNEGGRAVVISFHSLEDRIVKNFFRDYSKEGNFKLLTKKPIEAQEAEMEDNPRSRSAKLRAIEKI